MKRKRLNSFKCLTEEQLRLLGDAVETEKLWRAYQAKRKVFDAAGGFTEMDKTSVLNRLTPDDIQAILND